jgi:hypothetical protein
MHKKLQKCEKCKKECKMQMQCKNGIKWAETIIVEFGNFQLILRAVTVGYIARGMEFYRGSFC